MTQPFDLRNKSAEEIYSQFVPPPPAPNMSVEPPPGPYLPPPEVPPNDAAGTLGLPPPGDRTAALLAGGEAQDKPLQQDPWSLTPTAPSPPVKSRGEALASGATQMGQIEKGANPLGPAAAQPLPPSTVTSETAGTPGDEAPPFVGKHALSTSSTPRNDLLDFSTPRSRVGAGAGGVDMLGGLKLKLEGAKGDVHKQEQAIRDVYGSEIEAIRRQGELAQERDAQRLESEARAIQENKQRFEDDQIAKQAAFEKQRQYREETDKYIDEVSNTKIDPGRIYGNMDLGAKLSVLIGGALGGVLMGAGYTKENEFIKSMDRMIDQDIRAQEANLATKKWRINQRETVYEQMRRQGLDESEARQLYTEGIYKRALAMADNTAKSWDSKIAKENNLRLQNEVGLKLGDFNLLRAERAQQEAQKEYDAVLAARRAAAAHQAAEQKRFDEKANFYMEKLGATRDQARRAALWDMNPALAAANKVPNEDLFQLQKREKTPGEVDAQRFDLETRIFDMPDVRAPKAIAEKVNEKMMALKEQRAAIKEVLPLLGNLDSWTPQVREKINRNLQVISNRDRTMEGTGVPNIQDLEFLLVHPDENPSLDLLGRLRTRLQYAYDHDETRYKSAVRNALAAGVSTPVLESVRPPQ